MWLSLCSSRVVTWRGDGVGCIQVEDIQLSLENGAVLSANELEQVEMQLMVEKGLRNKLGRWRQNEYKNAAHMEDWRMERENMQKVRGTAGALHGQLSC